MQQPQPTLPFAPAIGFARNRETAPAYWMLDLLWLVLIDGHETGGAFSVMEQWMRQGSGPPVLHIHPIDEWFYVMEGEMTVQLGDQTIIGRAGDSLWIPRGTVHRFKVTTPYAGRNLALVVFPGGTAPSRAGPPRTGAPAHDRCWRRSTATRRRASSK